MSKENENLNEAENPQLNIGAVSSSTWFDTHQIETFVGEMEEGMTDEQMKRCRKKLVILHQCGNNKEALISQLETLIQGIKDDFEWFAS
jgi:hypothetical protein